MQFVKKYGRTVVIKNGNDVIRWLSPNATAAGLEDHESATSLEDFLLGDADFLISIWCSTLDKCFFKHTHKNWTFLQTYEAREKLKIAIKNIWLKKQIEVKRRVVKANGEESLVNIDFNNSSEFLARWDARVHPYRNSPVDIPDYNIQEALNSNTSKNKPKDFCALLLEVKKESIKSYEDINSDLLAERIYEYLYGLDTLEGRDTKIFSELGAIRAKARAIQKTVAKYEFTEGKLQKANKYTKKNKDSSYKGIGTIFTDKHKNNYQLQNLIQAFGTLKAEIGSENENNKDDKKYRKKYFNYQEAMQCLYEHYPKIFKDSNNEKLKLTEAKDHDLWDYHCAIKDALKIAFNYRKKSKRGSKDKRKPKNVTAQYLHNLVRYRQQNRDINHAIRIGKVIHYTFNQSKNNPQGATVLDLAQQQDDCILQSHFWQSAGQTEIKQNEAFVRIWLTAITHAASSLEHLLDPNQDQDDDHLLKDPFDKALVSLTDEQKLKNFSSQFKTLFGQKQNLIPEFNNDETLKETTIVLVKKLRDTLAQLRHASFHFKHIENFHTAFNHNPTDTDAIELKNATQRATEYLKKALERQQQVLMDELESIRVDKYLNPAQLTTAVQELTTSNDDLARLNLSKFSKFLQRDENTANLIMPQPTAKELENDETMRFRYKLLRMLYQTGFSAWLNKQSHENLNNWITEVKQRADTSAKSLNKNSQRSHIEYTQIQSRFTKKIPHIKELSLQGYFEQLNTLLASDHHVQQRENFFKSNPDATKTVASIITKFKNDFLALAFKEYLQAIGLNMLTGYDQHRLKPKYSTQGILKKINLPPVQNSIAKPWLYLVLHLMPLEVVNSLSLSIRKHMALNPEAYKKNDTNTPIGLAIYQTLSLYLDIRNANTEVDNIDDLSGSFLKDFYDDNQSFYTLFDDSGTALIPKKALKEVIRYGSKQQLKQLFTTHPILEQEIQEYKNSETTIPEYQEDRKKLHKELQRTKTADLEKSNTNNISKYKDYMEAIHKIAEHRHLKNRVYLHHVKLAHQIIIGVMGKYVSYSQLWERDQYFYLLFLMFTEGNSSNDGITYSKLLNSPGKKAITEYIESGQIVKAINGLRNFKEKYIHSDNVPNENKSSLCQKQQIIGEQVANKFKSDAVGQTRNDIAHFNPLRSNKLINLTDWLNNIRELVSYDRKLKNSVAKSIIDLLGSHNLQLQFGVDRGSHHLVLTQLSSKSITHLNQINYKICKHLPSNKETIYSDNFVSIIAKLWNSGDLPPEDIEELTTNDDKEPVDSLLEETSEEAEFIRINLTQISQRNTIEEILADEGIAERLCGNALKKAVQRQPQELQEKLKTYIKAQCQQRGIEPRQYMNERVFKFYFG